MSLKLIGTTFLFSQCRDASKNLKFASELDVKKFFLTLGRVTLLKDFHQSLRYCNGQLIVDSGRIEIMLSHE